MNNFLKLYTQLLEYDRSLKKDGTSFREQDRDKYLKLLNYSVKLSDHVHWQQKNDYLNIMKSFVDLKIDGKQFVKQFNKLHGSNQEAVKILKTDLKQLNIFYYLGLKTFLIKQSYLNYLNKRCLVNNKFFLIMRIQ